MTLGYCWCPADATMRAWTCGVHPFAAYGKKTVNKNPGLLRDLERLIEPVTRGDLESPLRWTGKSLRKLTAELNGMGLPNRQTRRHHHHWHT